MSMAQVQNGYRFDTGTGTKWALLRCKMGIDWGQVQNGYSLGTEWVEIGYRDRDTMGTAQVQNGQRLGRGIGT